MTSHTFVTGFVERVLGKRLVYNTAVETDAKKASGEYVIIRFTKIKVMDKFLDRLLNQISAFHSMVYTRSGDHGPCLWLCPTWSTDRGPVEIAFRDEQIW